MTNLDVTLDAIGNVTWKSDVGSYSYHATKRRAVVSAGSHSYGYDANGNMTTRDGSTIAYASYNVPTSIAAGANTSSLSYGAWRNRSKQVSVTSGSTETTIYVAGLMEKVTGGATIEYRHLINGTPGTVAIYTRRSSGTNDTYYLHRDHLGSGELITIAAGTAVVKLSFGAYGERRDTDWDGPISSGDLTTLGNTTRHGYTDHEHLDSVGLIHMGGRVYDPVIGRFLSRDPYIDGVGSSQGANGYAYVWNNPLTRWDPTGYGGQAEEPETRIHCHEGHCQELETIDVTGSRYDDDGDDDDSPLVDTSPLGGGPGGSTMPEGTLLGGSSTASDPNKHGPQEQPEGSCPAGATSSPGGGCVYALGMNGWLIPGGATQNGLKSLWSLLRALAAKAGAARGTTTLYRSVSAAEHADIAATGALRAGPNSIETAKWFAESAEHAQRWGRLMDGPGNFQVIEATFPRSAADQFLRNPMLDGIGPARFGTFEQLGNPIIKVGPGP